ncbi:MAG TPA: hypothetical protein VGI92_06775 [Gemmatimonadales bacterium]|jgi:hypothetical protein
MMDRLMQLMVSGMLVLVVPVLLVCGVVAVAAWRRRGAPDVPNESSTAPASRDR